MNVTELLIGFVFGALVTSVLIGWFFAKANNETLKRTVQHIILSFKRITAKSNGESKRISKAELEQAFNISKYPKDKFNYIDYLPITISSPEHQLIDSLAYNRAKKQKESQKTIEINKLIKFIRGEMTNIDNLCNPPINCEIKYEILNINDNNDMIPIYWIKYAGSNLSKNGVILHCHGGAYMSGTPKYTFPMLSLLSKLSGMIICSVDYRKAPEFPLPRCISDVCNIYKYFINNNKFNPKKTVFCGESAGGGLVLLALQKLKHMKLPMPCCCWAISPWTNIACDLPSCDNNDKYDAHINIVLLRRISKIVASKDICNDLHDPIISPLYGKWDNICPIFFQVGATEVLLDDTLKSAQNAYNAGVSVKVEIQPYCGHVYPIFVKFYPEAREACVRGVQFIRNHITTV